MLAPRYWPHAGGVERHVDRVARVLQHRGHEVSIVTEAHDSGLPESQDRDGVRIWRAPQGGVLAKWRWLAQRRALVSAAEIIHCHDYITLTRWFLPWASRPGRARVFITFHGHEGRWPIPRSIRWERHLAERLTRGNICIGHYIPRWYGTRATIVLYGGLDEVGADPLPCPRARDRAIFLGRLAGDTGILTYLRGLHALRARHGIDLPLEVHGGGPIAGRVAELSQALDLGVRLHGPTERPEDVFRANAGGIAFVSGYLSILEAMAHRNLPVVCYETPLKRDYVELMPGADRFLAVAGTAEEVAERVVEILALPADSRRMRLEAARGHACQQTWDRVADAYERLWAGAAG